LSGKGLSLTDFNSNWQGDAQMSMDNARLNGLNIQQLVQQAVSRSNNRVQGMQRYEVYSDIQQLQAHGALRNGVLTLSNLSADSAMMRVKITGGWQGDNDLIATLQKTEIPLRVFGPWKQLNYQLRVDQILRQQLQQDAKNAIQNWIDKNKDDKNSDKVKSFINKM
jgi:AsmA protein